MDRSAWTMDPFHLGSPLVTVDRLQLVVEYGGGCVTHTFTLVVSRDFRERFESGGAAVEVDALVADLPALREAYRAARCENSGAIVLVFDEETQVRFEF